ncbi:MAG: phosphopantetheine-binding protein, partial [Pseudomonadota bacterium]
MKHSQPASVHLVEYGPDGARTELAMEDLHDLSAVAAHALAEALPADTQHIVICFNATWEGIALARAALRLPLRIQLWQAFDTPLGWKDLRRRCASLQNLARKPVLITPQNRPRSFEDADFERFSQHITIDLSKRPADKLDPSAPSDAALLLVETGGTSRAPRLFALKPEAIRAALPKAAPGPEMRLEVAPLDTRKGLERLFRAAASEVVLNAAEAAAHPFLILEAAEAHSVTALHLPPGQIARLLRALQDGTSAFTLPHLERLVVSGQRPSLPEISALAARLSAFGASGLAVEMQYAITECGLVASSVLAGSATAGLTESALEVVPGVEARIVNQKFERLGEDEIGHIRVHSPGAARQIAEPDGTLAPFGHTTGWIDTDDVGFINADGLTLTSRRQAQIVVPKRIFQFRDLERKLSQIEGLRSEMLAALTLRRAGAAGPTLAICFSALNNTKEDVSRIASQLFSAVVSLTGLQPEIYHCREIMFPLNISLAPRREELRRLINGGSLTPAAQPRLALEQADWLSRAELRQRLATVWQNTLQMPDPPASDADFFALGGDSLNLTTMLNEVEGMFRQTVDIEAFFRTPTIAGLSHILQSADQQAPLIEPASAETGGHVRRIAEFTSVWRGEKAFADSLLRGMNTQGTRPPLFWILQSEPSFLTLAEALGPEQPLYAMRSAVGIVEHYGQDSLEEITNRYLWEIMAIAGSRPLFLGGNCQGAIIALTLARRLQQIGRSPKRLVMMEWFFDFGGYTGPTTFLTGEDSFVAELQQTVPSLTRLKDLFPQSDAQAIAGAHGQ